MINKIYLDLIDTNNIAEVETFSLISEFENNINTASLNFISDLIARMDAQLNRLEKSFPNLWDCLYSRYDQAISIKVSLGG